MYFHGSRCLPGVKTVRDILLPVCFTVSTGGTVGSEHPEVHMSIDSIKLFKNVGKSDTFQKLLGLVLMCMVLAQCVRD